MKRREPQGVQHFNWPGDTGVSPGMPLPMKVGAIETGTYPSIQALQISKWVCCVIVVLLSSCGGSISDEQRKKLKEGIEDIKITQISDTDIVTTALDEGKKIFENLKKSDFSAPVMEQLAKGHKVRIRYIEPGKGDALEVENQIIQAYIVGSATGATQDNIQKLRSGTATSLQDYDTLLYSRPMVTTQPDGSVNVDGVWNIYLAKRDIVRSLSRK